jgi:hypothetical protein
MTGAELEESPLDDNRPAAEVFYAAANSYCDFIERTGETDLRAFVAKLEQYLSQLAWTAVALPNVAPSSRPDVLPISEAAMTPISRALAAMLGAHDSYRQVYDPFESAEHDVVGGSLSDDLADIYRDLKRGVDEWCDADSVGRQDIVWEWRFGFESHWGQHLLSALRVAHWLRHRHMMP